MLLLAGRFEGVKNFLADFYSCKNVAGMDLEIRRALPSPLWRMKKRAGFRSARSASLVLFDTDEVFAGLSLQELLHRFLVSDNKIRKDFPQRIFVQVIVEA